MASKHLYELEDVAAAFLYYICEGNLQQAVYAAKELHDSGEHDLLWNILTLAWLLCDPNMTAGAAAAFASHDVGRLLLLLLTPTHTLPTIEEPCVLPMAPKPSKHAALPEGWHPLPKQYSPEQSATLYKAIKYSLSHKFWEHAAYLIKCHLGENTLSMSRLLKEFGVAKQLTDLLETTVFTPLSARIVDHACAALVAAPAEPVLSKQYKFLWNTKLPNGRSGRRLIIPGEALATWRLKAKPVTRLTGVPMLVVEETAAQYWADAVKKHNISVDGHELLFADDAQTEAFYESYFPEDIPDEWSTTERAKSHGQSVPPSEINPWLTAFLLCWS
jgi:hypothetical protein